MNDFKPSKGREANELEQPLYETTNDISPYQRKWEAAHPELEHLTITKGIVF